MYFENNDVKQQPYFAYAVFCERLISLTGTKKYEDLYLSWLETPPHKR